MLKFEWRVENSSYYWNLRTKWDRSKCWYLSEKEEIDIAKVATIKMIWFENGGIDQNINLRTKVGIDQNVEMLVQNVKVDQNVENLSEEGRLVIMLKFEGKSWFSSKKIKIFI